MGTNPARDRPCVPPQARRGPKGFHYGACVGGKSGARHRRGARDRPRDRAQARHRRLRRRRQLLQQRGRGRSAVRANPRTGPRARARSRAASASRTASTRCSRSSASISSASTSWCQQRGERRAQADRRHDVEALALVPRNECAGAEPADATRAAADARRRPRHRDVEPGRAARDARAMASSAPRRPRWKRWRGRWRRNWGRAAFGSTW